MTRIENALRELTDCYDRLNAEAEALAARPGGMNSYEYAHVNASALTYDHALMIVKHAISLQKWDDMEARRTPAVDSSC